MQTNEYVMLDKITRFRQDIQISAPLKQSNFFIYEIEAIMLFRVIEC